MNKSSRYWHNITASNDGTSLSLLTLRGDGVLQDTAVEAAMLSIPAQLWLPVPIEDLQLWFLNPGRLVQYFIDSLCTSCRANFVQFCISLGFKESILL